MTTTIIMMMVIMTMITTITAMAVIKADAETLVQIKKEQMGF